MRIGELARRTGVSERSLRYYEQQGLLSADRTAGGTATTRNRPSTASSGFKNCSPLGCTARKITQTLPCMRDVDGVPSEIATPRLVEELADERDRINRMVTELTNSCDILDHVIYAASQHPEEDTKAVTR